MTPKEKAEELFNKYIEVSGIFVGDYENEKEMCLIAVDETLKAAFYSTQEIYNFYIEVRKEIENFAQELKLQNIQL